MNFERLFLLFKGLTYLRMYIEGYKQQSSSSVIGALSLENGQTRDRGMMQHLTTVGGLGDDFAYQSR